MEKITMKSVLMILTIVLAVNAETYFAGLNLDPVLLLKTDAAITDLKKALYNNFDCVKNAPPPPGGNLRWMGGPVFAPFKSVRGYSGYSSYQSVITCPFFTQGFMLSSLYSKITCVTEQLQKIRKLLIAYNNIIIGDGNAVTGTNNIVIGSKDILTGNNNWVFTSEFQSTDPLNGVLIIGVYLVELTDLFSLLYKPADVIHCLGKEESSQQFSNFWGGAQVNKRFCF